jgi:hypothetical protein
LWIAYQGRESHGRAVGLEVKYDVFAMGGGDNPLAMVLVADGETVVLQLGDGEKIGDANAHKP